MLNNLIKKFNAKSNKHLLIIFIIFALSGSGSLFLSSPILSAINLEDLITYYPLYFIVRIIIIIPIYQLMLIMIATLFGEFNYFWKFEKKFLQRLKLMK
jgi:manganese efflux pump family protein